MQVDLKQSEIDSVCVYVCEEMCTHDRQFQLEIKTAYYFGFSGLI